MWTRISADDRRTRPSRSCSRVGVERVKVRVMIRLIERDGWRQVRQKGSHRQFHHPTKPGTVTVSGHRSEDLRPGIRASIVRQAGLKR
ncbi:MAG TPA: type II toxin-antitoxin system HicA family toxin [Solirubrobacteraceae bacterium]|nr:type II toxin-antitoxin system HicA family toxin [Solirubrobacteraceae bacterium]